MAKKIVITKDKILEAAFKIVREKGIEEVSNRTIAKELDSSIRPIYYQFKSAEELKEELYKRVEKYFYQYITKNMSDDIPYYKQVGLNYIKFAREESNFFKLLFMTSMKYLPKEFISRDEEDYREIAKLIKLSTKLDDNDIKSFHMRMWFFTHDIATLLATDTIVLTDNAVADLLSSEFQALMLLEENKDNKWILNKDWRDNNE